MIAGIHTKQLNKAQYLRCIKRSRPLGPFYRRITFPFDKTSSKPILTPCLVLVRLTCTKIIRLGQGEVGQVYLQFEGRWESIWERCHHVGWQLFDVGRGSFEDCDLGLEPLTGDEVVIHAPEVVGRRVVVLSEKTWCARARSRHFVECWEGKEEAA